MSAGDVRHSTAGPRALAAVSAALGLAAKGWTLDGLCAAEADGKTALRAGLRKNGGPLVFRDLEGAGRLTAAAIARLIAEDPDTFVEVLPGGAEGDRVRVPCLGQPISLLEAGWRNFYADQDFEVLLGVPDCSSARTVNVEFADLECFYARPKRSFDKWTFLDWPEESEDGPRAGDGEEDSSIIAELEERDMIMGTGERADAVVEEVRKRAKDADYILFTHLCTPIVMGEDLQGLALRCEKEAGASAVRWSQKDRDDNDNFGEHFRALLARPGFMGEAPEPGAVNLFHFPKACREAELRPWLAAAGVKVNVTAFPDVDLASLERLPKGAAQVFCARSSYPTKVRELLAKESRPVTTVPAPYGVESTRACLAGIAAAAGKAAEFEEVWAAKEASFLPAWEEGRRAAAAFRLAFVVSEATLPRLAALRHGHGAPLALMAAEMGFGVDVIYYDRHGEPPGRLPAGLATARVSVFRAPKELERALTRGEFHAVYSDVFFDPRITRAGKARFSGKDFEMGLEGARRTQERLLGACRLPFYRRYAAHLGRSHVL